jgi:hypothetical protein
MNVLSLEVERELTEADILDLRNLPDISSPLKTISARHRHTAMLVAEGKSNNHIAEALNFTPARVGQLRQDPAFKELVHYYYDQIHEEALSDEKRIYGKVLLNTELALDHMTDRLEDPALSRRITTAELRQIADTRLDRTVAPPKVAQSQLNPPQDITLNFGTQLRPVGIGQPQAGVATGPLNRAPSTGSDPQAPIKAILPDGTEDHEC